MELAANHFGFSTSAPSTTEKHELPAEVRDAYRRFPSFTRITSGWKVSSLVKVPHLTMEAGKEHLLFSPDKGFAGKSLQAYKHLHSFQLFDENVHDIEMNEWEAGTYFYFVRAKFWPLQDTSKSARKCIVCLDRVEPRIYGAHC